ncbi:DoxX family protein [Brevibacillus gelatini]|uniref:DoxX family protein n=1 Tax=Brevibacillus gelatini TaxID=1655277 RepID=A0A3M8B5R5_9BACL|nr:DoxX family protein [Brevibacillus gelatini]RNB58175.1 DoxX family protein [Brevibacillus gelatini]
MAYEKAFTVLRMATGLLFLLHGLAKLQKGMGAVTQMFGDLGLPWWLAYLVLAIELIGGLAFLLGIGAKYAAWGLAGVMAGAIVTVKWKQGFIGGYELDLILLAVTICVGLKQTKARPG